MDGQVCDPSTQETEAGEWAVKVCLGHSVSSRPEEIHETVSKEKKNQKEGAGETGSACLTP